eukprot:CAMPEP_0202759560 /NCGR_PEP_ID=MMETSP1388-20130828/17791_1 /ASSEMBLY_ACC=CAM_ASM_000864 /TAXON_ID=37098 /ORGANISM="Isochrysis sp, Strain CCMP1244" /LENGTH=425 /DNA_ID=CAMNT_0049427551 /DNA_START=110 /DNA_END=1384 /DNA_ORIENTATION=+
MTRPTIPHVWPVVQSLLLVPVLPGYVMARRMQVQVVMARGGADSDASPGAGKPPRRRPAEKDVHVHVRLHVPDGGLRPLPVRRVELGGELLYPLRHLRRLQRRVHRRDARLAQPREDGLVRRPRVPRASENDSAADLARLCVVSQARLQDAQPRAMHDQEPVAVLSLSQPLLESAHAASDKLHAAAVAKHVLLARNETLAEQLRKVAHRRRREEGLRRDEPGQRHADPPQRAPEVVAHHLDLRRLHAVEHHAAHLDALRGADGEVERELVKRGAEPAFADEDDLEAEQLRDGGVVEADDGADPHVAGALDDHVRVRRPQRLPGVQQRLLLPLHVDLTVHIALREASRHQHRRHVLVLAPKPKVFFREPAVLVNPERRRALRRRLHLHVLLPDGLEVADRLERDTGGESGEEAERGGGLSNVLPRG